MPSKMGKQLKLARSKIVFFVQEVYSFRLKKLYFFIVNNTQYTFLSSIRKN